jgi:hypothetical protein
VTGVQVLLTLAVVILIVSAARSRRSQRTRAAKKLIFLLFAIASILAILSPAVVQRAATLVGVGRGSDLVLYVTVILVLYMGLDFYLRLQDQDEQITRLTRALAIADACARHSSSQPSTPADARASQPQVPTDAVGSTGSS